MPIFDRSASRPGCAEADLLRSVLGLAKPEIPVRPTRYSREMIAGGNGARASSAPWSSSLCSDCSAARQS